MREIKPSRMIHRKVNKDGGSDMRIFDAVCGVLQTWTVVGLVIATILFTIVIAIHVRQRLDDKANH